MYENNKYLIIKAQNGDNEALGRIIEENSGLIWSIVKRFLGRGYEKEDLYQIASIGFIKAIRRFDFEFNVRLSTYAVQYMIGEIKKFLRDDGIIKISRTAKELGIKIKELERDYLIRTGESLSIIEMAKALNVSEEDVCTSIEANKVIESINQELKEGGVEKIDRIITSSDEQNKIVDKITVIELIKALNIREKRLIILRYFKEKTQTQVAKIMGISQVQVSRIERRVLREFREKMA